MAKTLFELSQINVCAVGISFVAGPDDGTQRKFFLAREAIDRLAGARTECMVWESVFYRHASRIRDVTRCLMGTGSSRLPIVLGAQYFP